jgi:hypothetical protein
MSNLAVGNIYSCSDNGEPNNVSSLVQADDNGGWNTFSFFFAGANALGQNRIYAANEGGQLLSYSPTNPLSDEVIVGSDGWAIGQNYDSVFAGVNLLGENHIYAVTNPSLSLFGGGGGDLLSFSDDGTPGNVGHPVTIGNGGWGFNNMRFVFAGKDSTGIARIYAVRWDNGDILAYVDDGNPSSVKDPVTVGTSIWGHDFGFLFAGANSAGQNRIYGVNVLGQLLSYSAADPVSDEVIIGEPAVINDGVPSPSGGTGWLGFRNFFAGVNSAGKNLIYGVYGS